MQAEKQAITSSNFAMWKAAIALAYCDHQLSNSEADLIHSYMDKYDFSESEKAELDKALREGTSLDETFPLIENKRDRAHLINFALVLFHRDGKFCANEEELWEKINHDHKQSIDMKQALVDAYVARDEYKEEEKMKRQEESLLERAFSFLIDYDG